MPIDRSAGAPDALGATMSSGPEHLTRAGGARASRPDVLQISDMGDTYVPTGERAVPSGREDSPVNGIDQTAVGEPSQSMQPERPRLEDVIFDRRGEPGRIQRFEVLRRLGTGGMGVVYAAYDWELERRLAIKVMRDDSMTSDAGKRRILREAQAMAKLSHPNVVQVYEVGTWADQIFVAMEYVKGKSLSDWLHAEERTWQEILEMYVQAGRGLAAAHRQGVVHRDFKPDNVLVDTDGRARVLDFGLARAEGIHQAEESDTAPHSRLVDGDVHQNLTMVGAIMGTPAFMSPEQHSGKLADASSDQFSFCVALYVGLYGRAPFMGETLTELSLSVTSGELQQPPLDTRVPPWVFAALQVGLATDPADRYPSMDTLLAAVSPDTVVDSRRRWLWPAALVGATVLAVLATLSIVGGTEDATGEDLGHIARLEREAHDAAARRHWVYPDRTAPRDTAYNRVVLLEHLEGASGPRGLSIAASLRAEFAAELVVLGDRYFDNPSGRPYARDYYAQALVFMPYDPRASARARVSIGQLADLAERAAAGGFSEDELIAVEPLRILADPDAVTARADALALASTPEYEDEFEGSRLSRVFRGAGLMTPADLHAGRSPPPPSPVAAPPQPPQPPQPPAAVAVASEPAPGEPPASKRRAKSDRPATPVEPPPAPAVPEEDMSAKTDPAASKALSSEADAARKRGDAAAAEKLYNQALDLWNGNAAAMIGLSDLAFERGSFDRAVKYAEKAVRADPGSGDYQLRLGDAYFKVFRYSDAQQRYTRAAELGHPKAAERLTCVQGEI